MDVKELQRMTTPKLRDLAKELTDLQGVLGMHKDDLIKAIAKAQGIAYDESVKDVNAIHAIKQDIRALRKEKAELLTANSDRKKLKRIKRKVKLLKRLTRHLAHETKTAAAAKAAAPAPRTGCPSGTPSCRINSMKAPLGVRGRGSASNPKNRFETIERIPELADDNDEISSPLTQFFNDTSKSIIAYNDSPDVGFDASVNAYRGCEHGCVYCYARPTHEYLGFSSGLDFESKIMVKEDAPELLRKELSSAKWKPQVLAMSGVTDCYQPAEKKRQLTRRCLEVLLEFRNPVVIVTKNYLVTRDIDIFRELARYQCVGCYDFAHDVGSQTVLRDGAAGFKSGTSISGDQSAGGSRNSSGLPASADDSRPHRLRGAGDCPSRRRSGRDLCGLRCRTPAVCRESTLRGLARAAFPRSKRKSS